MPFKARKAVFDKLLEVADVASLSRDERIQSIKQSGDSLRRSRLIFLNYLPVITRLFHGYLPDCLAGLDDVAVTAIDFRGDDRGLDDADRLYRREQQRVGLRRRLRATGVVRIVLQRSGIEFEDLHEIGSFGIAKPALCQLLSVFSSSEDTLRTAERTGRCNCARAILVVRASGAEPCENDRQGCGGSD